jgi:MerR family Zn(II)-responsive transcriptional regulator of zntA
MRIGELSKKSGFSKDTIRFYEKKGLIQLEDRSRNRFAFKDYPEPVLRRLLAIREVKEYGFTLEETLGMIAIFEAGVFQPERGVRYVQRKIARMEEHIQELLRKKARLQEIVTEKDPGSCPIGKLFGYSSSPDNEYRPEGSSYTEQPSSLPI